MTKTLKFLFFLMAASVVLPVGSSLALQSEGPASRLPMVEMAQDAIPLQAGGSETCTFQNGENHEQLEASSENVRLASASHLYQVEDGPVLRAPEEGEENCGGRPTKTITRPSPACGFNDIGAPNPGEHFCVWGPGPRGCDYYCKLVKCLQF
jgi:hypothetical protein